MTNIGVHCAKPNRSSQVRLGQLQREFDGTAQLPALIRDVICSSSHAPGTLWLTTRPRLTIVSPA